MWLKAGGELVPLPLPSRSSAVGAFQGRILATLQEPWTYQGMFHPAGSLVALNLKDMTAEQVFAPSERQALIQVRAGKSYVFTALLEDVVGKVRRFERKEGRWTPAEVPLTSNGVVTIAGSTSERDDWFVLNESLTAPQTLYHLSAKNLSSRVMSLPQFYDASNVAVEQHFATSKDGTRVPYFVMGRKQVLAKGMAPTIQYGYGGFLSSVLPVYYANIAAPQNGALSGKLWVSRGGVFVLSNIRGGGEYGPRWHEAALKEKRQRAFDDFFAISEDLVARGVTRPKKLGAMGASNGGSR